MKINLEKKEKCLAAISVEVPADIVTNERSEIVKQFSKNANIKGFRKGKAPANIIEKRFAKDIHGELVNKLIDSALKETAQKETLNILRVNISEEVVLEDSGEFKFSVDAVLEPTFDLPIYKELEVSVPSEDISDEDVDAQLEDYRVRFADFDDTETPLEKGEFAIVDYKTDIDGKAVEEVIGKSAGFVGDREGQWVKIEDDAFLPGFVDQLIGSTKGEQKNVPIIIPDTFPIEALRGKTVNFDLTIKETKKQTLPDLNDEFAEKLIGDASLDNLKELIKGQLESQKTGYIKNMKEAQVLTKISESVDFDIPEDAVKAEAQNILQKQIAEATQQGLDAKAIEEQQEEFEKNANEQATLNVRNTFVLQKIATEEKIEVTNDELLGKIGEMAEAAKKTVKSYIAEIQKNRSLQNIQQALLLGKTIDFIVDNAKVTVTEESQEEVSKDE